MADVSWITNYGFLGIRLFELPSLLTCFLVILFGGYKFNIPNNYQIVLALHCLLPFVLNDVLFNATYMPDQFRYWHSVNELRSGELGFIAAFQSRDTVLTASALLALIPLPTPVSIISLGFYNTFL